MPTLYRPLALLGLALAAPVQAAPSETETTAVRVTRPASDSPRAQHRLDRRIAAAALEACGASPFSLPAVKEAVARSSCWRQSYADGIAQAGIPARGDALAIGRARMKDQP